MTKLLANYTNKNKDHTPIKPELCFENSISTAIITLPKA